MRISTERQKHCSDPRRKQPLITITSWHGNLIALWCIQQVTRCQILLQDITGTITTFCSIGKIYCSMGMNSTWEFLIINQAQFLQVWHISINPTNSVRVKKRTNCYKTSVSSLTSVGYISNMWLISKPRGSHECEMAKIHYTDSAL